MTQAIHLSPSRIARLEPIGVNLAARERWHHIATRWITDSIATASVLIGIPSGFVLIAYLLGFGT